MPRLVCPACKTTHRVSVLQPSYRELPCKGCGRPIPLLLATPSSPEAFPAGEEGPEPPAAAAAAGSAASAPTSAALETAGIFSTRTERPEGAGALVSFTVGAVSAAWLCAGCGAKFDARLAACPVCAMRIDQAAVERTPQTAEAAAAAVPPGPAAQPPDEEGGAPCPSCGGWIRTGAVKCWHCKTFLAAGPAPEPEARRQGLGRLALALAAIAFAVAVLLLLVWLRQPRPALPAGGAGALGPEVMA